MVGGSEPGGWPLCGGVSQAGGAVRSRAHENEATCDATMVVPYRANAKSTHSHNTEPQMVIGRKARAKVGLYMKVPYQPASSCQMIDQFFDLEVPQSSP